MGDDRALVDVIERMTTFVSDAEFLRGFAASGVPGDLTALVERYVDLVYSAARRQLGDGHLAQDVTQQVFLVLLRKGRQLRPETVLGSWLLKVTSLECRNVVKAEARRARRERKVAQMRSEVGPPGPGEAANSAAATWEELSPHLDAALEELAAGDREAVVLRYFLNRSYEEAALALGASEGSVRQRVHRGLKTLRAVLGKRGVVATEVALSGALAAHAVESAPAAVVAATASALGSAAVAKATISTGVWTIMSTLSPMKVGAIAALILLAVGVTVFMLVDHGHGGETKGSAASATAPTSEPVAMAQETAGPQLAAPPALQAPAKPTPPRKVFDVITAKTCDARQGTKDGYEHIGFINRGDWLEYDGVEFPSADAPRAMAFCAVISCPEQFAGNEIEVHLGAPDGPLISTLTVDGTAGYSDFVCQEAPIQTTLGGKQDVFLVFSGGGFNIRSIKFAVIDGRPADQPIAATGYANARKVNEAGKTLVNVRNGAWARYDWLQFPKAGADTISLAYSVDAARAGGVISVRLDLPTSKPVCEIPIISTSGYGHFYTRTMKLTGTVEGNHDVFLTFSGTDKGYQGLADVGWFCFNETGKGVLTPPPPPPATRPTTGPTTMPATSQTRPLFELFR